MTEKTDEQADSDVYPWVRDFDDVWHGRPRGRGWIKGGVREDDAQAETLCSRWIPSVHVSEYRPDVEDGAVLCECAGVRLSDGEDTSRG